MKPLTLLAGALLLASLDGGALLAQKSLQVRITSPKDGARVAYREEVSGSVSDSETSVWLVIHPLSTADFWIQPPITVREDGTWKVIPYFGRSLSQDINEKFEVRAFARPVMQLKEGNTTAWPAAQARSNVIEVSRK